MGIQIKNVFWPTNSVGALAAEIPISISNWKASRLGQTVDGKAIGDIENTLVRCFKKIEDIPRTITSMRKNAFFRAINDGQRKFNWYNTKHPQQIISKVSEGIKDIIYKEVWDGLWSENMDWTEDSEDSELIDLAKKEALWILCFNIYEQVIELILNRKVGREDLADDNLLKFREHAEILRLFSSHSHTKSILPYINSFERKHKDPKFLEEAFHPTLKLINDMVFNSKIILGKAEDIFAAYKRFPDISFYTDAIYIESEFANALKKVTNLFSSICFKLSKNSDEKKEAN